MLDGAVGSAFRHRTSWRRSRSPALLALFLGGLLLLLWEHTASALAFSSGLLLRGVAAASAVEWRPALLAAPALRLPCREACVSFGPSAISFSASAAALFAVAAGSLAKRAHRLGRVGQERQRVEISAVAGICVAGTGSAVPPTTVSNHELAEFVDTSHEWVVRRTGIASRHLLQPKETLAELAVLAAKRALSSAGVDAVEVELVLLATSSPDDLFGSATEVAAAIGATKAVAFDLTAACSGFVFALVTAAQYFRTGAIKNAVVIGADCLSRYVDWSDRGTCVLFGDGAGAVVLTATDPESDGLLEFEFQSDGSRRSHLTCGATLETVDLTRGKQSAHQSYSLMKMDGNEVFRFATSCVPEVISKLLLKAHLQSDDIDWLLLHQANRRILDSAAKRLSIPESKVICNVDKYGNTSAASIPLALDEAVRENKVKRGHLLALVGFGAGLSWGGCLLRL